MALCADVLVLEDETGGVSESRTTHACGMGRASHSSTYLGAFHTCVGRFRECGVGIPVNIVSLALDPGIESSEAGYDHAISELVPVE